MSSVETRGWFAREFFPKVRAFVLLGFWFGSIAFVAPFLIAFFLIFGRENIIYSPVRLFVRAGLALAGVKVEISGVEQLDPKQAYIFTPNHQSFIEVPLLIAFLDWNPAFLAKKEVFKYPIFGYGIGLVGVVPVDRSNSQSAVESARKATENLRRGKSYIVYPEGTRSPDGRLQPFKKGAFLMALDAGVPVVPISISGATEVMPKATFKVFPETVRVTVHPPIPTADLKKENVAELVKAARDRIAATLEG